MSDAARCVVCGHEAPPAETATVRSNVRAFSAEAFPVWRCAACRSVHAGAEVDLDAYYAGYPVHEVPLDWRTRPMYDLQRRRLMKAGLRRDGRVLDYGAGGGAFLAHLAEARFPNAFGYDPYSKRYSDRAVLAPGAYDCVVSQDVIEHVADPLAFLEEQRDLVRPGGLVAVGTPDAAGVDLARPEAFVHALHQPYHRHILSREALRAAGEARGLRVVRHWRTMYVNTRWPFINSRFVALVMKARDDTLDAAIEPPSPKLVLWLPWTVLVGLFGSFFATPSEMMTIFERID
ncbi:MAG: class I SAM-dependent methyltransferase [Myxococcales bacterium]|nr:class I SAM-dependent methyltransferase [Myxococcales bacterium]MCB9731157.1 class I SAM-dependent methyltransferase [Deltaproteobacteria bacterium]